ncbi:uncharacterized protein LOC110382335 [Helicoverpa armigera]|uniref:uncharacterized protein LOC110382335 n=1 Tax=Helicoverpa armigera TaxID=29058 RepID=UPI0021117BAC|nr:uncharacterized protein LOC110382335 [Helicoverpa armigera]
MRVWLAALCAWGACVCVWTAPAWSSFWAPLWDRRLLNYRVDAAFEPQAARAAREHYAAQHGYRGETLIADLGNGKPPPDMPMDVKMYGDVKFYYT